MRSLSLGRALRGPVGTPAVVLRCVGDRYARATQRGICESYFFTLLASILIEVSSILVENAVCTSKGFSMPRYVCTSS